MSVQKKISEINISEDEKEVISNVLDLEKKYFEILWNTFTSDNFITDLKIIEQNIQHNYDSLVRTWDLKNKLKIPAERLARQYIYKDLAHYVHGIYPSPVSSDIAFITEDAVINLDVKTLDINGNKGDISNLQFENNQSSFKNNNLDEDPELENSGIKVECLLPTEYSYKGSNKTMLTFFLTIVYNDDGNSFQLSRDCSLATIQLKCLPNGKISKLFEYDIVNNFKTYHYFEKKDGFEPIFLTENKDEVNNAIIDFIDKNPGFDLIQGRTKWGAFASSIIHPYYQTLGLSFFPVKRKKKTDTSEKYFLEAVKCGHTNRISNSTLENRFDSKDISWFGIRKHTIE